MSLASKLSAGLLAAACVCSLTAAEVLTLNEPADFTNQLFKPAKQLVKADDALSVKGQSFCLFSVKTLTLDPTKKYTLSLDYRQKEGDGSGVLYVGFVPFNAEGKQIRAVSVNAVKNTEAVVAKAAKSGDTVVYLKDASKWDLKTPYGYIVFDAKEDYADLPNFSYIAVPGGNIKQDGDVWEITLKEPLKKDIAEGTVVRQQKAGSAYIYSIIRTKFTHTDWLSGSGKIDGSVSKFGTGNKQLWPGTASVRILVMMQGGKRDSVFEFKNIRLEEAE